MTKKKYRVHEFVQFSYSEIREYIDENHTDRPLRNDEVVELLNKLPQLKKQHRELQIEFNNACGIIHDLREDKLDLEDENEELKQWILNIISLF